jgi:hypothetical protein
MQYMLLICGHEDEVVEPGEMAAVLAETAKWVEEHDKRGIRLVGNRLRPTSAATTVRVENGEVLLSDGPFAETKEQILGFDLLECADLDEAIEVASKHPSARRGHVEVRPIWPI